MDWPSPTPWPAAALGQPVLLVPPGAVPGVGRTQAAVARHALRVVALGSTAGVSAATLASLQVALGG